MKYKLLIQDMSDNMKIIFNDVVSLEEVLAALPRADHKKVKYLTIGLDYESSDNILYYYVAPIKE